jgi:hypothetical protein
MGVEVIIYYIISVYKKGHGDVAEPLHRPGRAERGRHNDRRSSSKPSLPPKLNMDCSTATMKTIEPR